MNRRVWRDVAAFCAALLTALFVTGGLLLFWQHPQTALLVGLVAGLAFSSPALAGAGGGMAVVAGGIVSPPHVWTTPPDRPILYLLLTALGCAVVAAGLSYSLRRFGPRPLASVAVALFLGAVVVNLWVTTVEVDAHPVFDAGYGTLPPILAQLGGAQVPADRADADEYFYRDVLQRMGSGQGYYAAFRDGYKVNPRWRRAPREVINVRMPTVFFILGALRTPYGVILGYLVLATAAVLASIALPARFLKLPLALPAVAGAAAFFLYLSTQPAILSAEAWAAPLVLISASAWVVSREGGRTRWAIAAVVAATAAALIRESSVFVMLGGVLASLAAPGRSKRSAAYWAAGLAVFFGAYAVHYRFASRIVEHSGGYGALMRGGLDNVLVGVRYGSDYLGAQPWLPVLYALLALGGVALVKDRGAKLFLALLTLMPLAAFAFFGNDALDAGEVATNYWGGLLVPLLLASSPLVMLALPSAGRRGASEVPA